MPRTRPRDVLTCSYVSPLKGFPVCCFGGPQAEEADYITQAVELVAAHGQALLPCYRFYHETGEWKHTAELGKAKSNQRRWLQSISYATGAPVLKPPRNGTAAPLDSTTTGLARLPPAARAAHFAALLGEARDILAA
eukprot:SAG22_NODE_4304_length_1311_cov_1.489274_3_plen_136_part_01